MNCGVLSMILALDVGNTNIKTGLFDETGLRHSWRIASDRIKTADEYGILMESCFEHLGEKMARVEGVVMSSVIPSMNYTLEHMCTYYFHRVPMVVTPNMAMNITLQYDDPYLLGTDRICNAVAAYENHAGPVIVVFLSLIGYSNVIAHWLLKREYIRVLHALPCMEICTVKGKEGQLYVVMKENFVLYENT